MPEITQLNQILTSAFGRLEQLNDEEKIVRRTLANSILTEEEQRISAARAAIRKDIRAALENFERYPHRHYDVERLLAAFHAKDGHSFRKSVFIMCKYPDGTSATEDQALETVQASVAKAVRDAGYTPRFARDERYHDRLWNNVRAYMLGCHKGIAIVEDKYRPELNPNVAMEWGWMEGMGRPVLYLRENQFRHGRADWDGLLWSGFDWGSPNVTSAVASFLGSPEGITA